VDETHREESHLPGEVHSVHNVHTVHHFGLKTRFERRIGDEAEKKREE